MPISEVKAIKAAVKKQHAKEAHSINHAEGRHRVAGVDRSHCGVLLA